MLCYANSLNRRLLLALLHQRYKGTHGQCCFCLLLFFPLFVLAKNSPLYFLIAKFITLSHFCGSSRGYTTAREQQETANKSRRPRRNRIDRNQDANHPRPSERQPKPSADKKYLYCSRRTA